MAKPTTDEKTPMQVNPPSSSSVVGFAIRGYFQIGGRILMRSEGVWKYADWEAILNISILMPAAKAAAALAERLRLPGNRRYPDDFSLAMLDAD